MVTGSRASQHKHQYQYAASAAHELNLCLRVCRYGYAETVVQDEAFASSMLQRIQVLLYSTLQAILQESPDLQRLVPTLPPIEGEPLLHADWWHDTHCSSRDCWHGIH